MTTPTKPAREPRTPLSRERVLRAALAIADESAIGSLTMRKLGEALGVEAMSLYNHVANKDELLDRMVDLVFGEIELPSRSRGTDWKVAMRERAVSARKALSRHRWAVALMSSRTHLARQRSGTTTPSWEAFEGRPSLSRWQRTRCPPSTATSTASRCNKASLPHDTEEATAEVAEMIFKQFGPDECSYPTELTGKHVLEPGHDYGDKFEFGLDLMLDGFEKARGTT
jgi:AcrR family transcriptional regulator